MSQLLEDYALIGDTHTAALVGRDGSVDWLCVPRFDSGSCFAKLLGSDDHGRWLLAPDGEVVATSRAYRGRTMVLETEIETAEGKVRVTDFMPPRHHHPRVVRVVTGVEGTVRMRTELTIRFEYGADVPWVRRTERGLHAIAGPNALTLDSPVRLTGRDLRHEAVFTVEAGQRVPMVLSWHLSHDDQPFVLDTARAEKETEAWWEEWCSGIDDVHGEWQDVALRSLITLKALTYAPTGGIVAAATTSLPEDLGGVRNWDYRYCWVRDATLTLDALIEAGCVAEARAWMAWLGRAAAGAPEQLQIMYGPAGERRLTEYEVDWLPGYENSAPVRIGNAASDQFQLDVYGELMDAIDRARSHGVAADGVVWQVQRALMAFVEDHWGDPDDGIWEVRGPRQHFTHSRVMAWVAFDRAVRAVERYGLDGPVERWREARQAVHQEVCDKGWDPDKRAFTQHYGSSDLDASVLMIPLVGFLPPDDPRVVATVEAVQRELVVDGFVLRYQNSSGVDGLPGGEGAFLPCTFWLADCLALMGRTDEARSIFTRLAGLANDVGLLSEEYDPKAGRLVGNFPQAFTHVGLINTARNLAGGRSARLAAQ
ncbi:glycoside hydrolase family 15 protein [Acidiferrimicrobium sp. IK]|uniref:glycoside hydrolase family 15 protein n=1 Tax=Acidiferrimicrobium sp. IK TaxID=2871700 RepID=UPI0021CB4E70|nr:glycoside hydrolase family 15 protein [Acidiferrimicrobium sp. IK]MCU4186682.1 glycoside hydrolase family 15 protein [Acidiferrimicrobium sp. IK]